MPIKPTRAEDSYNQHFTPIYYDPSNEIKKNNI